MPTPTKQILRLQSDQILDGPQIGTRISLQDLAATRKLDLIWQEPATTDREVTFKDPGGNDAVVYENLAQTLNNKTLPTPTITDFTNAQHDHSSAAEGGTVSHASLSDLATGDPHTMYAILAGRAGGQVLRGGAAAGEHLELESTSDATKGEVRVLDDLRLSLNKNIFLNGGELTGLPAVPSGPTAATSKAYVDAAISGGAAWRETLLSAVQLDNANQAIAQASAFFLVNNPINGDTLTVSDGSIIETWTFAATSAAFQVAIGGSAITTMQNLETQINADSTAWSASLLTDLQGINPTGHVLVIYRKVPTLAVDDRVYGTFATPADAKHVDFGGLVDYRSSAAVNLPSVDPGAANFGFSRTTANLTPNEAHLVRAEDDAYMWNEDAGTWQLSAGATSLATSGPGGGTIGQSTFDSDKGLEVTAGVAAVKVDTTSIAFNGSGELSVAGGAVPTGTSAPGGGVIGKVSADEDFGLEIAAGVMRARVDGSSIDFDPNGRLRASGAPLSPKGEVSHGILLTRDIPGVTAPSGGFIAGDVPVQIYSDGVTTGQLMNFVVPEDYDSGPIEMLAIYQMSTPEAADIVIETQAKIVKQGGTVDTTTFPATANPLTPPNSTDNARSVLLSISNGGGANFARGDTIQFYIKRLGADVGDTHTGAWIVSGFMYRYMGQVATRVAVQAAETFTAVSGETPASPGLFNSDIPTVDYAGGSNQAMASFYVVPDHWDGSSGAYLRIQYAMSGTTGGTVRLETSGYVLDVVSGATTALPVVAFDIVTTADTDPHRTVIVRTIPDTVLSKGSVIAVKIKRDTTVLGNNIDDFQLINATLTFGVIPVSGFVTANEQILTDGVFGNASGSVFGDTLFPDFAGDFETYYRMRSTAAAGVLHVAFTGRLQAGQTQVSSIRFFLKGVGANPEYSVKVYAEGSGAAPVYSAGPLAAPGTATLVEILSGDLSAQPTGNKRYHVVVESAIDANEEVLVGRPFVSVT